MVSFVHILFVRIVLLFLILNHLDVGWVVSSLLDNIRYLSSDRTWQRQGWDDVVEGQTFRLIPPLRSAVMRKLVLSKACQKILQSSDFSLL